MTSRVPFLSVSNSTTLKINISRLMEYCCGHLVLIVLSVMLEILFENNLSSSSLMFCRSMCFFFENIWVLVFLTAFRSAVFLYDLGSSLCAGMKLWLLGKYFSASSSVSNFLFWREYIAAYGYVCFGPIAEDADFSSRRDCVEKFVSCLFCWGSIDVRIVVV